MKTLKLSVTMYFELLLVLLTRYSTLSQSLYPIYNVSCSSDNHYECGFQVGVQGKERIKSYIRRYPNMEALRRCLIIGCSVDLRDLIQYNQAIWPQYYQEMEGVAAGAEVDEMDIHLLS